MIRSNSKLRKELKSLRSNRSDLSQRAAAGRTQTLHQCPEWLEAEPYRLSTQPKHLPEYKRTLIDGFRLGPGNPAFDLLEFFASPF
jgi:hypothetical protein